MKGKYRYFVPLVTSTWFACFKLCQCDILNHSNGRLLNKNGIVCRSVWTSSEMDDCVKLKQWEEIDMAEAVLLM